jgi:hypothetical protein
MATRPLECVLCGKDHPWSDQCGVTNQDVRAIQRLSRLAERDPTFLARFEAWLDSLPNECDECGQGGTEPCREHKATCSRYRDWSTRDQ